MLGVLWVHGSALGAWECFGVIQVLWDAGGGGGVLWVYGVANTDVTNSEAQTLPISPTQISQAERLKVSQANSDATSQKHKANRPNTGVTGQQPNGQSTQTQKSCESGDSRQY